MSSFRNTQLVYQKFTASNTRLPPQTVVQRVDENKDYNYVFHFFLAFYKLLNIGSFTKCVNLRLRHYVRKMQLSVSHLLNRTCFKLSHVPIVIILRKTSTPSSTPRISDLTSANTPVEKAFEVNPQCGKQLFDFSQKKTKVSQIVKKEIVDVECQFSIFN